ncbi:MAG: LamG-like jellyroll fold domain-containing protein [Pseudomonadota bacterium]
MANIGNFDPATAVATAAPAIAYTADGFVPSEGSGLAGEVYVPDGRINNIDDLRDLTNGAPQLSFVASEIAYAGRKSDTTVEEFLDHDAGSLTGDGSAYEMGPSGIVLTGYIYIPPGAHEITIASDDGFSLSLGGQSFSAFETPRATEETSVVGDFAGGLYEIELLYFDQGGGMSLYMEIDGLPVDQSAFYQTQADFLAPPNDVALVPAEDYHPGAFLGADSLDVAIDGTGTDGNDVINGKGADDTINGGDGDDILNGGYGDDVINGGAGDDVIDGGRGSDVIDGGEGNDTLISRSDAGVSRIGQLAIGMPTRDDPDNEVNDDLQMLKGYENLPLHADDVLIGGSGSDTFLIEPLLNAKQDIIEKHIQGDGTINWAGVAGENNELHDHWVDAFGIDIIADYNAEEDHIAVIGHTANVYVSYADVIGDEAEESIITVISNQHGGGGAHAMDLIGQVIVSGDRVEKDDIQTDDGVTYGIVEGYEDIAEALYPQGDEKISTVDGVDYKGYDSRSPADMMGNMDMAQMMAMNNGLGTNNAGAIIENPGEAFENANFSEDMLVGATEAEDAMPPTRGSFDQVEEIEMTGQTTTGNGGANTMMGTDAPDVTGLPGAIAYYSFADGNENAFSNAHVDGNGGQIKAYALYENQALPGAELTEGPNGDADGALYFNGEDTFAFLEHDPSYEVSQGTIAMWVRPDDLGEKSMFVSKDHTGQKDGGHFRLGHDNEGNLFLRMATGDGKGGNKAWETNNAQFTEGEWSHVAVSFTDSGVTVYVDGQPIPANQWNAVEGDSPNPNTYTEAFFLNNQEPWVFGADTFTAELNDTAQEFATDDEDLKHEFEGGIADFGFWGGMDSEDALDQGQIQELMDNGPGDALVNPSGPDALIVADDTMMGGGGADTMDGLAGDDMMYGENGADTMNGGYGNDYLEGGAGNDVLDGGRGNDYLDGGDGDDILYSRSDAGEQRAGQLVLDDPSRPAPYIDPEYLKLHDWVDQPLQADDVLVGGDGADQFKFEIGINGTKESIMDNLMPDGRTIHWHGVAGENRFVHDHWVDAFGIDVIADYDKSEGDTISVIGHTVNVKVDYQSIDSDGDGYDDDVVSIITAYSQQGNGGGAHDEDYVGYVVVHGDRVELDDIETDAGAHYGIVTTIDELQEAFAPNGELKTHDDPALYGYDSRDVDGDPIGSDPAAYSDNPWLLAGEVEFDYGFDANLEAPNLVMYHEGGTYLGGQTDEIPNTAEQQQVDGTISFAFNALTPGNDQNQALVSKDHSGFEDGGHFTAYIATNGELKVRFQGTDSEVFLRSGEKIEAGEDYHVAFTFDAGATQLYLNGELVDTADGYPDGMSGNAEDLVIGAATRTRQGDDDNLTWHFDGEVSHVAMFDRVLEDVETVILSSNEGDPAALAAVYDTPDTPPVEEPEEPAEEPDPVEEPEEPAEEPEEPAEEAEEPAEEPEEPAEEPEEPAEEPEEPAEEPEEPAEEPEEPAEEPEEPAEEPEENDEELEEIESRLDNLEAMFDRLINVLLQLLSFLGGATPDDDDDDAPAPTADTLLSDLIPVTPDNDDDDPMIDDDDEDDMSNDMVA